jgi:hypothetical protein
MATYSVKIQDDPKPPFPFSMVEGMMPMFPMIAVLAFMIVLIAFIVGLAALAPANVQFFGDAKAIREGAEVGSTFVAANVDRHVLETWVPNFKFLGLGLGLLAINMALGIIAKRLRRMGKVVNAHMPATLRPALPEIPKRVKLMQMSAMMGIMLLVITFLISLALSGVVGDYFNHSIASELNPAQPGSALLNQLATVASFNTWLAPLRMIGMMMLFTGIIIALTTIIYNLRKQSELLVDFSRKASSR